MDNLFDKTGIEKKIKIDKLINNFPGPANIQKVVCDFCPILYIAGKLYS
jgi:hypothetical protein